MTITGGVVSLNENGGGIHNSGTLTLTSSTISGNTAGVAGGGIFNAGILTVTSSTISENAVGRLVTFLESFGGGINNDGTLTVTSSTISGNTSTGERPRGGGIQNAGTATVTSSTISGNTASGIFTPSPNGGGGLHNTGTLTGHPPSPGTPRLTSRAAADSSIPAPSR